MPPPFLSFSFIGEASHRGVRAGSIVWIGSPVVLTRCPFWKGDTSTMSWTCSVNGEWWMGDFLKWFKPQRPSTSINIHQRPSTSINIHQVNGGFSPSKISTWTNLLTPSSVSSNIAGTCRNYPEVSSWENDLLQAGGGSPLPCLISRG